MGAKTHNRRKTNLIKIVDDSMEDMPSFDVLLQYKAEKSSFAYRFHK